MLMASALGGKVMDLPATTRKVDEPHESKVATFSVEDEKQEMKQRMPRFPKQE